VLEITSVIIAPRSGLPWLIVSKEYREGEAEACFFSTSISSGSGRAKVDSDGCAFLTSSKESEVLRVVEGRDEFVL
jgi:hypothetical protein